ncbi:uncharacterized protein LOC126838849 [Adelges cooleyi]|uniref:uncharacterized protein LOC126838849 n=1 Tax=Adelges cooleyi TaxID=133065 RepID=UPI00218042B7|nr:uncharacterized protein LOC126838849 [Adelges cooleyi]XP_050429570.1 uncharacterized protein LOC126838849 [Adelges cooleyi]XP_050429579.1 uncharacterized protein LOC126838849 [Adelges cooleyi]XP_050429586.1 uncharacterized protein LOC126838849 [Adelges cooleyi]
MRTTVGVCVLLQLLAASALVGGRPVDDNSGGRPVIVDNAVIEVEPGATAVLECPSNDKDHRFQFWWLKSNEIIGPGSDMDSNKFRYEVLTGTLYIKEVTPEESGVYTCVCKNLGSISMSARSVNLAIKRDWEDVWENDYTVNTIRVVAVLSVLTLILLLVYLYYLTSYKTTNRTLHFREDDSEEDVTNDKQIYRKTTISKDNIFQTGIDNPTLEKEAGLAKTITETKA